MSLINQLKYGSSAWVPHSNQTGYFLFQKPSQCLRPMLSAQAASVQFLLQTDITFKKTLWRLFVMNIPSLIACTHFFLQRICQILELFRPSYWQLRIEFHIVNHKLAVQRPRNCNSMLQPISLLKIPMSSSHCVSLIFVRLGCRTDRIIAHWIEYEGSWCCLLRCDIT
jgi:hypothetical protein